MRSILLAATLALAAGTAGAGPDKTVERFLNDPVSMLDWGMYRTEQFLISRNIHLDSVYYDWDGNRIIISDLHLIPALPDDVEGQCKHWVRSVRIAAMVIPDTGKILGDGHSTIGRFFRHNGFGRSIDGKFDSDVIPDLEKLIIIRRVYWIENGEGAYVQGFMCEGGLLSGQVSITRS